MTLVLAGDTTETVDESLRLVGVYVCLFLVCVSGRTFSHPGSLRGSVFFSDQLLLVMCEYR